MDIFYRQSLDYNLKKTTINKEIKLYDLLDKLGLRTNELRIELNGEVLPKKYPNLILGKNDFLVVTPIIEGGDRQETAKVVSSVLQVALLVVTAGQSAWVQAAVLVGGTLAIQGIRQAIVGNPEGQSLAAAQRSNVPQAQTHSIDSAGNPTRVNEPMALTFGRIRVFPDNDSNPYYTSVQGELIPLDNITPQVLGLGSVQISLGQSLPAGGNGNVIFQYTAAGTIDRYYEAYDTNPSSFGLIIQNSGGIHTIFSGFGTFETHPPEDLMIRSNPGSYNYRRHSFVYFDEATDPFYQHYVHRINYVRYLGTTGYPIDTFIYRPSGVMEVPIYNLQTPTLKSSTSLVLNQTFNFGFGDIQISDKRLRQTNLDDYYDLNTKQSDKSTWNLNHPTNVDVVDGQKLLNTENTKSLESWIVRRSPKNTYLVDFILTGSLYRSDPATGIQPMCTEVLIQYKETTSDQWLPVEKNDMLTSAPLGAPTATGAVVLNGVNVNDFYAKITVQNLTPNQYDFRIKKTFINSSENTYKSDIQLNNLQFFQSNAPNEIHTGQNRETLIIKASDQINGAIGTYNALVEAKCFAYDFNNQTWNWEFNQNPAWWFLYFAKGAYLNTVNQNTPLGNMFFGYDDENQSRIFGAGYKDDEIDIDAIIQWGQFCEDNDLKINVHQKADINVLGMLNQIANVGRGSVSFSNGKLSVIYEDPNQPVVSMFTSSNIIKDSFRIEYNSSVDLPDKIICSYSNEDDDYNRGEVEAISPFFNDHDRQPKELKVDLWGITNEAQAQRECNLLAAKQVYQRRKITWETDIEGLYITRGDIVYLSHDLTQWDFSGRFISFDISNGFVTGAKLSNSIYGSNKINIRFPDGTMQELDINSSDDEITFNSPQPLANFSYYLDQDGTCNESSIFTESVPHDFIYIAGPMSTPGKKVRIIAIEPQGIERVRITAIDEEPAYYAYEYTQTYIEPESKAKVIVKNFNACIDENEGGFVKIRWESVGAYASQIMISRNGSTPIPLIQGGSFSYYGNCVEINEATGTKIDLEIIPYELNTPFHSESVTISFEVN